MLGSQLCFQSNRKEKMSKVTELTSSPQTCGGASPPGNLDLRRVSLGKNPRDMKDPDFTKASIHTTSCRPGYLFSSTRPGPLKVISVTLLPIPTAHSSSTIQMNSWAFDSLQPRKTNRNGLSPPSLTRDYRDTRVKSEPLRSASACCSPGTRVTFANRWIPRAK